MLNLLVFLSYCKYNFISPSCECFCNIRGKFKTCSITQSARDIIKTLAMYTKHDVILNFATMNVYD